MPINETNIQSAAQAAEALKPFAGRFASALFALGFIGSGLLAIPVLAAAGSVGMAGLLGQRVGVLAFGAQSPRLLRPRRPGDPRGHGVELAAMSTRSTCSSLWRSSTVSRQHPSL
jgi:hypothetical protein